MLFYTYVLESLKDGDRDIGYTTDLKRRLEEHKKGTSFATKSRLPMNLIYFEACLNKNDAERREHYYKTTRGRRFVTQRLRSYYQSK